MVDLPQYGNVFPDDILARLRDLESAVNDLQDGTFQAVVTLAGDVTGQSSATTVARIRNETVEGITPAEYDVLAYGYNDDSEAVWSPGYVKQLNGRLIVFDDPSGIDYDAGVFIVNNAADQLTFGDSLSAIWGSGVDANEELNSEIAMPDWADRTGTTITLLRDVYCHDLSLVGEGSEGGTTFDPITVETNGYRIFCTGKLSLTDGVTLRNSGGAGSGSTAGEGGVANVFGSGAAGSAGSAGTADVPGSSYKAIVSFVDQSITYGGAGGAATGGPGTGGGTAGGNAYYYATDGSPHAIPQAIAGLSATAERWNGGAGGSGGNGSSGTGGGGGGGGGIVGIYARKITNAGIIQANGGDGGDATGTNGGGGGGGGGGAVILVYMNDRSDIGTVEVIGGTGGSGIGTGKDGGNGDDGYVWNIGL
jgi:hypothetical protein